MELPRFGVSPEASGAPAVPGAAPIAMAPDVRRAS